MCNETTSSFVGSAEEVGVEVVEIGGHMTARVAPPRIRLGVEAAVQKVQRLVRVHDVAVTARGAAHV